MTGLTTLCPSCTLSSAMRDCAACLAWAEAIGEYIPALKPARMTGSELKPTLELPAIRRQLAKISPNAIKAELSKYGAWNDSELADDQDNRARIVWIAACDIREGNV